MSADERLAGWRRLALDPPYAHGGPVGNGVLRSSAEDFVVDERLGFEADGGVAHLLLHVEKRERDTLAVASELARLADVPSRDVGFAGLKDRVAVARQWFTVPTPRTPVDWLGVEGRGFRVLAAAAHSRKLRRGALAGNAFTLVLRDIDAPPPALAMRITDVLSGGVPNYFGPQRFGRDGSNLERVADWLDGGRLPRERERRAFVLSAARSLMFNAVLAARVEAGTWNGLVGGECVNLDGRNSWFLADAVDETLRERLDRHDVHGTGPLAGRGDGPRAEALELESRVLAGFGDLPSRLEAAGVEAARRPLRMVSREGEVAFDRGTLKFGFWLPRGAYATALIREILATGQPLQESDDD
jgi:tRNA pseudouridine13 synthase